MKKLVVAGVAATALCGAPAVAADMAVKAPPIAPLAAPVYSWTGCYIGGNTGGAWAQKSTTETSSQSTGGTLTLLNTPLGSLTADGWAYGGQIGCDYQFNNNWVVGVRGMWDGSDMRGSNDWPSTVDSLISNHYNVDSFGTVVGKIGYLLLPTVELYAVGGVAWVHDSLNWISTVPGLSGVIATGDQTRTGYDVGVGLSWMLAPNWDLFLEYDHMGFGTKNMYLTGAGINAGDTFGADVKQNVDKVLVGIDYRFYWSNAPVAAKG
jgi:outer membrane immunogenic protein